MHRESGAVHVHVFWLIFFFLIAVAGWAAFTIQSDDLAKVESELVTAQREVERIDEQSQKIGQDLAAVSQVVGYRDADDPLSNTTPSVISDRLAALREAHPTIMTEEKKTLQEALPAFVAAYEEQRSQVAGRQQDISKLQGDVSNLETSRDQIQADLTTQISEKDSQIQAANARADQQERDLQQRIDTLRQREQDLESEIVSLKAEQAQQLAQLNSQVRERDARIAGQASKLTILYPQDEPDGKILEADIDSRLAFINLGRKDGVQEGMRFSTYRIGKGGVREDKGDIRVSEVYPDYAKAIIETPQDRFDPLGQGDIIVNPLFSTERSKIFVLVGRFPGRYNREQLKLQIEAAGGQVRETVGVDTDFLIQGEVGDPTLGEDEVQIDPTQTEEYQRAQRYGVQILSADDVIRYVRS
ncbi:MAG: hypothetical protein RL885_25470 [Planctomycetota bacterium]